MDLKEAAAVVSWQGIRSRQGAKAPTQSLQHNSDHE